MLLPAHEIRVSICDRSRDDSDSHGKNPRDSTAFCIASMSFRSVAAPVVWLTGLSGAGKTSIAQGVRAALNAQGMRCLLLDGDQLRTGLSRDLGFKLAERSENIRRAAEVAALVSRAGVPVVAALISPMAKDREVARTCIGATQFFEVHVDASLAVVEARDTKGLYAKARRGEITDFTGISSPYEAPQRPALRIDSAVGTVDEAVARVLELLRPWLNGPSGLR